MNWPLFGVTMLLLWVVAPALMWLGVSQGASLLGVAACVAGLVVAGICGALCAFMAHGR